MLTQSINRVIKSIKSRSSLGGNKKEREKKSLIVYLVSTFTYFLDNGIVSFPHHFHGNK